MVDFFPLGHFMLYDHARRMAVILVMLDSLCLNLRTGNK